MCNRTIHLLEHIFVDSVAKLHFGPYKCTHIAASIIDTNYFLEGTYQQPAPPLWQVKPATF